MKKLFIILLFLFGFNANINAKEISCDFSYNEQEMKTDVIDVKTHYDIYVFTLFFEDNNSKISKVINAASKTTLEKIIYSLDTERDLPNVFYKKDLNQSEKNSLVNLRYMMIQMDPKLSSLPEVMNLDKFHESLLSLPDEGKKLSINAFSEYMKQFDDEFDSILKNIQSGMSRYDNIMDFWFFDSLNRILEKNINVQRINSKRSFKGNMDNGMGLRIEIDDKVLDTDSMIKNAIQFELNADDMNWVFSGDCKVYKKNEVMNDDKSELTERLSKLKSLLDDGLISQDQYDLKSSEILNDL